MKIVCGGAGVTYVFEVINHPLKMLTVDFILTYREHSQFEKERR